MWAEKISFLKIMNQSNGFKVSEDGEKERNDCGKKQRFKKQCMALLQEKTCPNTSDLPYVTRGVTRSYLNLRRAQANEVA